MTTRHFLCFVALAFIALSCENHTYKQYDNASFPDYIWKTEKAITFSPEIKDISKSYNLILGVRHVANIPLEVLSLHVKTISPSGKEIQKDYDIKLRDADGKELSDCAGDMCDIESVIENIKFEESGKYTYLVTHNVQTDKLPGIMEVGLIIDEKK